MITLLTIFAFLWIPLSLINVYYIHKNLRTATPGYMKYLVGATPIIQALLTLKFVLEYKDVDIDKYKARVVVFLIDYCNTLVQLVRL